MPSHLTEVCRAGSACPRTLARPDADTTPSPAEVYRPGDTPTDGGLVDFLASAQSLILIAVGILAVALLAATTWHNRCEAHEEKKAAPNAQPPKPPKT
ncbi:hypothetical protein [Streptomyces scopuliridis]|uniref:hypothetical protein n=1 Tax=Streptomyces scopuliridis TaxID=452529 RepID=UPI0036B6FA11